MIPLDDAMRAELDQLAARVRAENVVDLGVFDEAELVAIGQKPVPRVRLGHASWPAFAGAPTSVRSASPEQRSVQILSAATSGMIAWFSVPAMQEAPPMAYNGVVLFSRWSTTVPGVSLVLTCAIDGEVDADTRLPTRIQACAAPVAVAHLVQAVFREPLSPGERDLATGTDCGVVVQAGGNEITQTSLRFGHEWAAPSAVVVPPEPASGRGFRRRRAETADPSQLTVVFERMCAAFVDVH